MANIQPFDYQKSTNIEEHNQIVNKVNEIVQVINDVNLDTINSEIATLQSKATATDTEIANIKNKDSMQDTEIDGITKSLVSNVTATFDNPSRELKISLGRQASPSIDATVVIPASSETGQYSEGNGIKIQDYQISVDTAVVALKSDIPVGPDVTELTQNITTLTESVNGKVAIAQGTENAGKVLGIGEDGNVTPVNAGGSSGGGEVWEEVNMSNFPTDWKVDDRVKMVFKVNAAGSVQSYPTTPIIEFILSNNDTSVGLDGFGFAIARSNISTDNTMWIAKFYSVTNWNTLGNSLFILMKGTGSAVNIEINTNNASNFIYKMWRLKAST